jgi:D-arabinose 1-dehydrogenase-like Zn-dependent alcohol dehydrogenase
MRAAVCPALKGKWEVREVPTPEPGPGQVLIRVHASGLCYTDVHETHGDMPMGLTPPCVFGHEGAGEVVAVGPGVTARKAGDRVGVVYFQGSCGRCEWCLRDKGFFCRDFVGTGAHAPGSHAEYMVALANTTMLIPDGVSYEQAAPIFCAGYTVWCGIRIAEAKPHETIAVAGIGGLGHLAIQYAKAAGFPTIAVTHSPDKVELAKQLGADQVVADGRALRKAGGADVILLTSNSYAACGEALKGIRPDGRAVSMGFDAAGPIPVTAEFLYRRGRLIGSVHNGPEYLYEALDYAAQGKVKVMTETYPLQDAARAFERLESGAVRFRAILIP